MGYRFRVKFALTSIIGGDQGFDIRVGVLTLSD